MVHEIHGLDEMKAFAQRLAARLGARQILLLNGPMGAGKTQLTRFLLEELGSTETVSPSFAIHNQYDTRRGPVDHVDLFRLENEEELESTGFWDLFSEPEGLVIIEWAERLPPNSLSHTWDRMELTFEILGAQTRRVTERNY